MLKDAKVKKHLIEIEFLCPEKNVKVTQEISNPHIFQGSYYEDWQYTGISVKCKLCGKNHNFEI